MARCPVERSRSHRCTVPPPPPPPLLPAAHPAPPLPPSPAPDVHYYLDKMAISAGSSVAARTKIILLSGGGKITGAPRVSQAARPPGLSVSRPFSRYGRHEGGHGLQGTKTAFVFIAFIIVAAQFSPVRPHRVPFPCRLSQVFPFQLHLVCRTCSLGRAR
ncbi:hypothetical protein E2C01_015582 [Portunus trituberculatus]|uniref:Uncharacterized protein n=1 Tax=Portunus trituberculatus TaxID=210409 RepID=A0A5B7DNG5_PORTR|nr:hypothetical protein [Portunus trituberculatus]